MSNITSRALPALSESPYLRYFAFVMLYLAQGIPHGMIAFAIPAWMAANGKTPGEIGSFVSLAFLPWAFKLVFGPFMDRYTILSMGRKRPWVIFGQLGLILSFGIMAFIPDPLNNLSSMMAMAFVLGCFCAFQDVATDGMAIDVVPVAEQARANGFMWGSKTIGISVSLAVGSWLINTSGYSSAVLALCVATATIMLVPLLIRERKGEKILPWTHGVASEEAQKTQTTSWAVLIKSLFKVFILRNSLLLAATGFLLNFAVNFIETLLPVFTVQKLGWTDQVYSQYYSTANLIGGIGGMIIGGLLIDRFGKKKMINMYFLLFGLLFLAFYLGKDYWTNKMFVGGFMTLFLALYVFTSIGFFALAMQSCWKKVSATQFTLYMAIANMGYSLGAKAMGPIQGAIGWEYAFLAIIPIFVLALILVQFLQIGVQEARVKEFEVEDFHNTSLLSLANRP